MTTKHWKYGGSTAERTLKCGAWIKLSEGKVEARVGMPASEGTMMHGMFESGMNDESYDPESLLGLETVIDGNLVVVTDDMVRKVNDAYTEMTTVIENLDPDIEGYEVSHAFSEIIGGIADTVLASRMLNCFAIGDLKTGDGDQIYAEDNAQLLFYMWMMVLKYAKDFDFNEDTEIVLFIIQPSERRDDYYDEWVTNLATIMAFAEAFKHAVKVAESGTADPNPGKWCKYCPASLTCPAKTGQLAITTRMPDGEQLDGLIKALGMVDDIEVWCREVRKVAHEQADQGVPLPGYKLVNKRATRVWSDPDKAQKTFKLARKIVLEDYMDMALKSPPQMEIILKKKKVDFKKYAAMIVKHSSGTTLVKESDKRQEALPLDALAGMIASTT